MYGFTGRKPRIRVAGVGTARTGVVGWWRRTATRARRRVSARGAPCTRWARRQAAGGRGATCRVHA